MNKFGLFVIGAGLVLAQTAAPTPSAKPTKNPTAPHHHFDRRHPHKSTRPQVQNPQQKQD